MLSSSGSLGFCTTEALFSHLAQYRCFLWGIGLGHEVRVGVAGTKREAEVGDTSGPSVWVWLWTLLGLELEVTGESGLQSLLSSGG